MAVSQEVLGAGQQVAGSAEVAFAGVLNAGIERLLGWHYKVASGRILDRDGVRTDAFATVVYTAPDKAVELDLNAIPADNAAAVIDVVENIDLAGFRAAYARIAHAKRSKKSPAPRVAGPPVTTIFRKIEARAIGIERRTPHASLRVNFAKPGKSEGRLSCSTLALDGPRITAIDRFLHPRPTLAGIQSLVLFDQGDVAGELRILDRLR